jgi:hypothetical protein
MKNYFVNSLVFVIAIAFVIGSSNASAQIPETPAEVLEANAPEVTQDAVLVVQPMEVKSADGKPEAEVMDGFNPDEFASLVFTYWEHIAIQDARRSRGLVRAPTEEELMRDLKDRNDEERVKPPPEERDISLNGIVYRSAGDWTIWLNSKRVTPDALPEEIIDLRVFDEYIEMKWFDEYTNQVFPIRLRPHQRFNIDVRMFLPG